MKFSFKKGEGGGEKKAKPKRKSRGGGDGLASAKAVLANHGEKILLGLVAAISIYVIYSGFSKEGLSSSPDDVRTAVTAAKSKMDSPTWTDVKQVRYPEPDTFDQLASADTIDINVEDFRMQTPLHPVLQEERQKRKDPVLLAPLELEVRPGYGAITVASSGDGRASALRRAIGSADENTRALPDKLREKFGGRGLRGAETESRYFISITGLVPAQAQQDAYRDAFAKAIEYTIERDSPHYIALDIERREVDPSGTPGDWVNLDAPRTIKLEPTKWDNKEDERAQTDHVIQTLMMPLPPIVLRDVGEWAVHSKIPKQQVDERGVVRERFERDEREDVSEEGEFSLFGNEESFTERGRDAELEVDESASEEQLTDVDLRGQLKVEFGMLRFFDFNVVPGKAYEYRARLLLEDANNPHSHEPPPVVACEIEVVLRRQQDPEKHIRETPWSEVSSPVRVPDGKQVFAGAVVAPARRSVSSANGLISLPKPTDEPTATVIGVAWDPGQKMDVPAPMTVKRGAVINQANAELEAVDPSIAKVVKLKDYQFSTDALVVDIAGGEALDRRGELRAPGLVLLMDTGGNLKLHTELGDKNSYELYDIPPDEELLREQQRQEQREEEEERQRERDRPGRGNRGQEAGFELGGEFGGGGENVRGRNRGRR